MKLIIAEKPSLAQAIRDVVPQNAGFKITHLYGHMLELAAPSVYDDKWAKWNVADLPIRVTSWKLLPKPSAQKQLQVIANLIKDASEVIHAGDPDREGQLLVDEVLDHLNWRGPTRRLLLTAADPETVRKALSRIDDNSKYQPLRQSAECRQRSDWLVGMNLSRAVTKQLSPNAMVSIGRVQTPTLAMVVRRHLAIANFTSETFYTLRARFSLSGGRSVELRCEPDPRISSEDQARSLAASLLGKRQPISLQVTKKSRLSPLPYHLGDFQKAAERHFGWSIAKSLECLQAAYEAKLTSYPRVDCRYLPAEQMSDAMAIAGKVQKALNMPDACLALMAPKRRVYDTNKVEVHHGIVPTGLVPGADTSEDARKAWELVSLNFLRTLLPDEEYEQTDVSATVDTGAGDPYPTLKFVAKAERLVNVGDNWKVIDIDARLPPPRKRTRSQAEPPQIIPAITDGEDCAVTDCRRHAGKTTAPEPYTESSLREDMSAVAKYVDDPRIKAILKETSGLGTPATQANIIETLKRRGYIEVKGKTVAATVLGVEIIQRIPPELADPGITAAWEDALSQVAAGKYAAAAFMARVDAMIAKRLQQTADLRAAGVSINAPAPVKAKSSGPARTKGQARPSKTPAASKTAGQKGTAPKEGKTGGGIFL